MYSIYLVRHGEYENPRNILPGRLPVALSPKGIQQAQKLHDYFEDKNIGRIYSSSVLRCKQTAKIIAGDIIPISYDKRLLETLSPYQGYWSENWHGDGFHFYSHHDELGGENLADIQKRMSHFWDEVTTNLQENIIICGHGDPLQTLYAYIYTLPLVPETTQETDIPGWIDKGSCLAIQWDNGHVISPL